MAIARKWTKENKDAAIEIILKEISNGKSVTSLLDNADRNVLPSWPTFAEWLKEDENLVKEYARATDNRIERKFESIERDYEQTPERDQETGKIDPAWVQLQRLKIDAKKWELSKLKPKKYGDKTILAGDEENPLIIKPPIFK